MSSTLTAAALIAALALASSDQGRIKAEEFVLSTAPEEVAEGAVTCGKGTRAVGGGVVQHGAPSTSLRLAASGPLDSSGTVLGTETGDAPKKWYVAVANNALASDQVLRRFVICSPSSKARVKAVAFVLDEGQTEERSVRCGRGRRALGGGVIQVGSAQRTMGIFASGPLDGSGSMIKTKDGDVPKQWYVAMTNESGGNDRVFKAFVICAPDSNARIQATSLEFSGAEQGEARARCGRSRRVLGGGVVTDQGPALGYLEASGPLDASGATLNTDTGDTAKQWYGAIFNGSGTNDRVAKILAVCAG